jgi:hypothetical protein
MSDRHCSSSWIYTPNLSRRPEQYIKNRSRCSWDQVHGLYVLRPENFSLELPEGYFVWVVPSSCFQEWWIWNDPSSDWEWHTLVAPGELWRDTNWHLPHWEQYREDELGRREVLKPCIVRAIVHTSLTSAMQDAMNRQCLRSRSLG